MVFANHTESNMAVRSEFATLPVDGQLPPVRLINNHLPPRHFRPPSFTPRETHYPKSQHEDKHKAYNKYSDGGSVVNFSVSGSESEDSYTDDSDDMHATYTYADDEPHGLNLNCMNSLFLPASNDHEAYDSEIIRCHRVGPTSAALELNIKLPARYMSHLTPKDEGKRSTFAGHVCKAPNLNYTPAQYDPSIDDEPVVEIDPYKKFRERVAQQVYESLIEGLSDDDGDSDEEESVRQRDDSQIFGEFDADRDAIYNEMFIHEGMADAGRIQSPPSQIFLTKSESTSPTQMTQNVAEDGSQEMINAIELSLDGSSDVFSRPEDGQDSVLNSHLRESVEVGNHTLVLKVVDPSQIVSITETSPGSRPAIPDLGHLVEEVPRMDEMASPRVLEQSASTPRVGILSVLSKDDCENKNDGVDILSVLSTDDWENKDDEANNEIRSGLKEEEIAPIESSSEPNHVVPNVNSCCQEPKTPSEPPFDQTLEDLYDPEMHPAPTFDDEPGRIFVRNSSQTQVQYLLDEPTATVLALVGGSEENRNEGKILSRFEEEIPEDEGMTIPAPKIQLAPSMDDPEAQADKNVGIMSPVDKMTNCSILSKAKSYQKTNKVLSSPRGVEVGTKPTIGTAMDESTVSANNRTRRPILDEVSTSNTEIQPSNTEIQPDETPTGKSIDSSAKDSSSSITPKASRLILEETSKANVRTEIYQTNIAIDKHGKSGRELRKDRIRPIISAQTVATTPKLIPRAASEALTARNLLKHLDEENDLDTIEETPDLEELLEFHSCEEEDFTMHARGEFSTSLASDFQ